MQTPELSVVFPCYNEEGNLPELIRRLDQLVDGKSIQVVLVNNGSKDASEQIFDRELKAVRYPNQFKLVRVAVNQGYGHGIMTGLAEAHGRILSYSHADLQCDPKNVLEAFELYRKTESQKPGHKFFVKGKRFNRREEEKTFSFNLDRIATFLMQAPMIDINGQPKMFSRAFFEGHIRDRAPCDLTFDVYFMARALKYGYEMLTVPVYFGERTAGVSSWNTSLVSRYRMASRFLKTVLKVRVQSLSWDLKE